MGSIRVVLNSTNTVISAQDYDAWGYPLENRSYQSTNTLYKFTSKERDNETSYDYFGARYYDSRIGRWGGVEPLLDKYVGATPYCYSLNNPIFLFDANGLEVFVNGDREKIQNAINDYSNLNVKVDKETGKMSVVSGKAKTDFDKMLLKSIKDEDINVNLNSVTDNNPFEWREGVFLGSKIGDDGKVNATQKINLLFSEAFESAAGGELGRSILHEIIEAYIGAFLFAGETSSGDTKTDPVYMWSHFLTVLTESTDNEIDYYQNIELHIESETNKYYYINKTDEEKTRHYVE